MSDLILDKARLKDFLDAVAVAYSLWVPMESDGIADFRPYDGTTIMPTEKVRPRLSVKKFFHPQRENMFRFTTDPQAENRNVLDPILPQEQTVVFGVSSCDARSVVLNALVFTDDPANPNQCPYYKARRDKTILIGLGCNQPCATCFCHATGGHPFGEEGLDVIMCDLGDRYLVKVLTEKGGQAAGLIQMAKAKQDEVEAGAEIAEKAWEVMPRGLKLGQPAGQETMKLFDLDLWEETAARCLGCGICTYLCPTCYCFDILDETQGQDGVRFRIWDSCMFPLYTLHASGHNPRPTKAARLRNRFMHKLKYFPEVHGRKLSCVGCGRCVTYCPVNIDIREVAAAMKAD
ncbi:MAG: 4Fe-4S dicluster domain-containing protein [Deltaproteobacteria bacterium]|nr:4Fe-4S dicluster domain-containing protein [Deltaproteobacteria bacterium]